MSAELRSGRWLCAGIEMPDNVRDPRVGAGYGWVITHDFTEMALEPEGEVIKNFATRALSPGQSALFEEYARRAAATAHEDNAVGIMGPFDVGFSAEELDAGVRFRMLDDDGYLYYEGRFLHAANYNAGDLGFEPLDDFGGPNAGATEIWYECTAPDGAKVWAVL